MNKKVKILFFLAILMALIPLGYKQFITKNIISNITNLEKKGFLVTKVKDDNGYLSTTQTYKLIISNPNKIYEEFIAPLSNQMQKPILKKAFLSLNGSELIVDLNILNFPVMHKKAVSIYLTSLFANDKTKDLLTKEISNFLKNKGLGENIDLNAMGKIISIKAEDIDSLFNESKNSVRIKLKKYIISNIEKFDLYNNNYAFKLQNKLFDLKLKDNNNKLFKISSKELNCNINRKDLYNYNSLCSLKEFSINAKTNSNQILNLNNIFMSLTAVLKKNDIIYKYKYKIRKILYSAKSNYKNSNIKFDNLKLSGSVLGIKKDIIDDIINTPYTSPVNFNNQQLKRAMKIINSGFIYKIDNLSADAITSTDKNKTISLGNIKLNLTIEVLKNNLQMRTKFNPFEVLNYLKISSKITLLKKDYKMMKKMDKKGISKRLDKFVLYEGDKATFNINFKDKKLYVNNKIF